MPCKISVAVPVALSPVIKKGALNQGPEPTIYIPLAMEIGSVVDCNPCALTNIALPTEVWTPSIIGKPVKGMYPTFEHRTQGGKGIRPFATAST